MSDSSKAGPKSAKPRAKYEKPQIKSESLTVVAAICNGTATGGRKATTGAPSFCNSARIKS